MAALAVPAPAIASTGAALPAPAVATGVPALPPGQLPDTVLAVQGARVTVLHTPGDEARARAYLDILDDLPRLPGLPDSVPSGVTAWLAPTPEVFDSLLGGQVPEWSAGVAVPSRRMLVLPAWRSTLTRPGEARRVLAHEWAHLGLHQWLDPLRVPRWFSEGYAQWVGGWDAAEAWRLRILLATGRAPPLDSLTLGWPSDRASADAAYLLSATVIEYLMERSGERGLELLFLRWRETHSFEGALRATYGVTSDQLEKDWSDWVKGRYGWLFVISHSAVFWLLLALGLLFMMRLRVRRNREQMARLRARDPPEEPAYWLPDDGTGEGSRRSGAEGDAAGGAGGRTGEGQAGES